MALFIWLCLLCGLIASYSSPVVAEQTWVAGWQQSSGLNIARAGAASATHNNVLYVIGGVDGRDFLKSVEFSQMKSDGTLSAWRFTQALPEARGFMSAIVLDQMIYVVGGGNGPHGKQLLNTVLVAKILENGHLSAWTTQTHRLMLPRRCSKLFSWQGALYTVGGFAGTLLDSVERGFLLPQTQAQTWHLLENKLTMPRYVNGLQRIKNQVFVVGGHHPEQGRGLVDVEWGQLGHSSEALRWQKTEPLLQGRYALSLAAFGEYLYALGGISGAEYLASIEKTKTDHVDGVSAWQNTTSLPEPLANFSVVTIGHRIFVVGGVTRSGYRGQVYWATFNDQGDIGFHGIATQASRVVSQEAEAPILPNSGTVLRMIDSGGYTYIEVLTNGSITWLAAPRMSLKQGDRIRYSEGVAMSNFYSKKLKHQFALILFVSRLVVGE